MRLKHKIRALLLAGTMFLGAYGCNEEVSNQDPEVEFYREYGAFVVHKQTDHGKVTFNHNDSRYQSFDPSDDPLAEENDDVDFLCNNLLRFHEKEILIYDETCDGQVDSVGVDGLMCEREPKYSSDRKCSEEILQEAQRVFDKYRKECNYDQYLAKAEERIRNAREERRNKRETPRNILKELLR